MKRRNTPLLDDHLTLPTEETYPNYWYGGTAIGAILMGGLSAYVRPYFNNGGAHWEAIISLLLLVSINIAWLLFVRSTQRTYYRWVYCLHTILLWMMYVVGWQFVYDFFMEDLIIINGIGALLSILIGLIVFYIQEDYPKKTNPS